MGQQTPRSFLYHGTSANHVEQIFEEGLRPPRETGESTWAFRDLDASPDHVYLTSTFAPHYGRHARTDEEPFAIVEVARPPETDLYPDEDYIEWALRASESDIMVPSDMDIPAGVGNFEERVRCIRDRLDAFEQYWEQSLAVRGTCAHEGTIPPRAIRRAAIVTPNEALIEELKTHDHAVGFAEMTGATAFRLLTRHLLDDPVDFDEYCRRVYGDDAEEYGERWERVRQALAADCSEVIENPEFVG